MSAEDKPMKAYSVPLRGVVVRHFVVYASSADEARALMHGERDPERCIPMDDSYQETGLGRVRRMPTEDRYAPPVRRDTA